MIVSTDAGRTIYDTVTGEVYTVPPAQTEPTDFWVAILDSLDTTTHTYADAQQVAAEVANEHGVETGVLWSDGWVTLNPGYWAVFTGHYPSRAEAAAVCEGLRPEVGSCYPRYVATAGTIDPAIGLGMLELRADGLGLVRLGDPVDETVAALVAVLGPPTTDHIEIGPFTNSLPAGFGADNYFRLAQWDHPQLWAVFSDLGGTARLIGWKYWGANDGPELSTPEGIGAGSTVKDLRAGFGDELEILSEADVCTEDDWQVGGLAGGLSGDPSDPATRITSIRAGAAGTC